MKTILRIGIVVVLLCLIVMPIQAQSDRVYEGGSVWGITYVKTEPGYFDDYLKDLSMVWKKYNDQYIKDGNVLSYKILNVDSPRDGEPNLILMVEFPNWATFDLKADYWDGVAKKVQGSLEKAKHAGIDRQKLRTIKGGLTVRELIFK